MSNRKSDVFITLGTRLREERLRINKTQDDLAKKFSISSRTWGMYERGKSMPDAWMLCELIDDGVDVYYVLTGQKSPVEPMEIGEEKIIKQYRNADESIKFAVNAIFDALKL